MTVAVVYDDGEEETLDVEPDELPNEMLRKRIHDLSVHSRMDIPLFLAVPVEGGVVYVSLARVRLLKVSD